MIKEETKRGGIYESPDIVCIDIAVEAGFALTNRSTIDDYNSLDEHADD